MQVVVVHNPIAGGGRAAEAAARIERELASRGHRVVAVTTRLAPPETWLDDACAGAEAMVVVGGDGAVRLAAGSAVRTGVPLVQAPLGTENLFAREFGMRAEPAAVAARIEAGRVRAIDAAALDGEIFVLMASCGIDAEIAHDLASRRRGGISHLSYTGPILRQIAAWHAPRLTIEVDGRTVVSDAPGIALAANSRQYALRIDPVAPARMDDGVLDALFLPATSALGAARLFALARLRQHLRAAGVVHATGHRIVVRSDPPAHVQVDGDALAGPPRAAWCAEVRPGALRVLDAPWTPAHGEAAAP